MAKKKKKPGASAYGRDGSFIEFAADELADLIMLLKPLLLHRAIRKDLRSYHFRVEDGGFVTISASDEHVRLQLRTQPMLVQGQGAVMIDAHALQAMLNVYGEPRVRIHLDDAEEFVRFEGLSTKVQLPAYDPKTELLKPVPGCTERSGWMFSAPTFVEAIEMTKGFVDEESQRYALGGLCFVLPGEAEGPCDIVSTDGRRLARYRAHASAFGDAERFTRPREDADRFWSQGLPVIPVKALIAARKLAKRAGNDRIALAIIPGDCLDLEKKEYTPGSVQIVTKEAVLTAGCEAGRFPRYVDVVPTEEVKCQVVIHNAAQLASILAVATAATNSESKGVDVSMAGGCMMFESSSNTRGKSRLSLTELEMSGQGSFAVDALYFRQFVDCLGTRPITIEFRSPKLPLVFTSGTAWDGVIMPLTRDRDEPATPSKPAPIYYNGTPEEDSPPDDGGNVVIGPEGPKDNPEGWAEVETSVEPEPAPVPAALARPSRNGRKKKK